MIHYIAEQLASFPWIVSCDTLKTEDLLPKFWSAAESCSVLANRPQLLNTDTLASLERLVGADSLETDWDDEQASQTLADLFEALNDASPCGFHFGSSDGDGACFGFWITEEWAEGLETLGLDADDPAGWAELIARLDLDGIEPDNLEDSYQGRAEGYSEESAGADFAQQLAQDLMLPEGADGSLGWNRWPISCIDWKDAWEELRLSDGYRLHDIGGEWLVFR